MSGAFADGHKGSEDTDDQEGVLTIRLHDIPLQALVVVFHYFYSNTLPSNLTTFLTPFARHHKRSRGVTCEVEGVEEEDVEEEEEMEEEEDEFVVLVEVLACANMLGVDAVVNECQGRLCDTLQWTLADYVCNDDDDDNVSMSLHGRKGMMIDGREGGSGMEVKVDARVGNQGSVVASSLSSSSAAAAASSSSPSPSSSSSSSPSPSPSPLETEVEAVLTTLSLALAYDCKILALRCRTLLRR